MFSFSIVFCICFTASTREFANFAYNIWVNRIGRYDCVRVSKNALRCGFFNTPHFLAPIHITVRSDQGILTNTYVNKSTHGVYSSFSFVGFSNSLPHRRGRCIDFDAKFVEWCRSGNALRGPVCYGHIPKNRRKERANMHFSAKSQNDYTSILSCY